MKNKIEKFLKRFNQDNKDDVVFLGEYKGGEFELDKPYLVEVRFKDFGEDYRTGKAHSNANIIKNF